MTCVQLPSQSRPSRSRSSERSTGPVQRQHRRSTGASKAQCRRSKGASQAQIWGNTGAAAATAAAARGPAAATGAARKNMQKTGPTGSTPANIRETFCPRNAPSVQNKEIDHKMVCTPAQPAMHRSSPPRRPSAAFGDASVPRGIGSTRGRRRRATGRRRTHSTRHKTLCRCDSRAQRANN